MVETQEKLLEMPFHYSYSINHIIALPDSLFYIVVSEIIQTERLYLALMHLCIHHTRTKRIMSN